MGLERAGARFAAAAGQRRLTFLPCHALPMYGAMRLKEKGGWHYPTLGFFFFFSCRGLVQDVSHAASRAEAEFALFCISYQLGEHCIA